MTMNKLLHFPCFETRAPIMCYSKKLFDIDSFDRHLLLRRLAFISFSLCVLFTDLWKTLKPSILSSILLLKFVKILFLYIKQISIYGCNAHCYKSVINQSSFPKSRAHLLGRKSLLEKVKDTVTMIVIRRKTLISFVHKSNNIRLAILSYN